MSKPDKEQSVGAKENQRGKATGLKARRVPKRREQKASLSMVFHITKNGDEEALPAVFAFIDYLLADDEPSDSIHG